MISTNASERVELPNPSNDDRSIQRIAEAVHRLNYAVQQAVDSGLSIELIRVSRHHSGQGNWGDQIVPTVIREELPATAQAAE